MGLNCGIVGLPNVGKSTVFSALSSASVAVANYPFCTVDPNIGIANVPDDRLDRITTHVPADRTIPATVEFVDIAGLVKGASQGEGLGNQFLASIREVNLIIHVVRCFRDSHVLHVNGALSPSNDIAIINTELALADLATVDRRLEKTHRATQSHNATLRQEALAETPLLERLRDNLQVGCPLRTLRLTKEDLILLAPLRLLTMKKHLYLGNVDPEGMKEGSPLVDQLLSVAKEEKAECLLVCGEWESEIQQIEDHQERSLFWDEIGLKESGLATLVKSAYHALSLHTFFTVGGKENRAWPFPKGIKAPEAAGIIHSDFRRGFIRAQAYHCSDLFTSGSEKEIKATGKLRLEGKEYVVQDGDVLHFLFSV